MSRHLDSELVQRYFSACVAGDRRGLEALLTPDFTFTSTDDYHIDRAAHVGRCRDLAGTFEYDDLKCTPVVDDECFVLYEGRSKRGEVFRNIELFRFRGDRIRSIEVFHGRPPSAVAAIPWMQRGAPTELTPSGV